MSIASIERHLRDLLVGDDLPDGRRARFHLAGVRLNFHLVGNLTDLKDNVDCRTGVDLKNDSRLHVRLEAGQTRLEHVGSKRQTREDIISSFIRHRRSLSAGGGLSYGDLDARQNGATLILDGAADLSSSRLRPSRSARHCKSKKTNQHGYTNAFHFPPPLSENEADLILETCLLQSWTYCGP